jgi:DUF1365 family protein
MNSAIYEGWVKHRRQKPVAHEFRYRLFMMYLDLAELDTVFKGRWFWSTERRALARFRRNDHFGDAGTPLETCVRDEIEAATGVRPTGRICLLTNLSYFGYCFNPVSFYYCFDDDNENLEAIIAEVNNTPWGERTLYLVTGERDAGGHMEVTPEKVMHVSPFMQMDVDYRWRLSSPADSLTVYMQTSRSNRKIFDASMKLDRTEITGRSLARVLATHPFMTFKVILAIHWQALRLWLKGAPVYDHPDKGKPNNRKHLPES